MIELRGEMVFPEPAILRIFESAKWEGRWIDSYRRRFLTGYWPEPISLPLPAERQATLDRIRAESGGSGGCFDVFCWRRDRVVFAESKWHDRILPTRTRWLESALRWGVLAASFFIVQWTLSD